METVLGVGFTILPSENLESQEDQKGKESLDRQVWSLWPFSSILSQLISEKQARDQFTLRSEVIELGCAKIVV